MHATGDASFQEGQHKQAETYRRNLIKGSEQGKIPYERRCIYIDGLVKNLVAQKKVQAAIQTQKDVLTKLPEADRNLLDYYKRLDQPIEGVTTQMRKEAQ